MKGVERGAHIFKNFTKKFENVRIDASKQAKMLINLLCNT